MKKKITALLLSLAMALGAGVLFSACTETVEAEHKTHYDVDGDGVCDKCGEDMEGHNHIYSVLWSSDENYHWHKATCAHESEQGSKAAHTYNAYGICSVCGVFDENPVASINGVYHFEAEHAILDDGDDTPSASTMVIEVDKTEFTESGKTDGVLVSNVGYFGTEGQTITWKFNSATAAESVKLTLRLASSDGEWSDKLIREIDLGATGAPTLTVNNANVSLDGKTLTGLDDLTTTDMQNGVAYHNFCEIEITINIVAGENTIVLTSGSKGVNVDKIMIETGATLTFVKTNNSARPSSH